MDFDDEAVCAASDSGFGHRCDQGFFAGAVSRIDDDRQMAQLFDQRDCGQRKCVAGFLFEGANAAFTENHIWVAVGKNVFGGEQELFNGGTKSALEQDRFLACSDFFQKFEVLHVAGADLEHVAMCGNGLDIAWIQHFGDGGHAVFFADFIQNLKAFFAEALKRVWAGARFVGSGAHDADAHFLE